MSEISSFRFWCQKVLPAVYDDSLSYYELLCKVVAKLNEVINSQNGTNDHVTELAQQFEQLKNDLQGTIESEAEKVVDNYVKSNNLVKSINGITAVGATGEVTLQASDVGAIANVSDSVKENNIQNGAVTADKLAPGAVPVKSVNGKTGEVQITAEEIGALPNTAGGVGTTNLQDGAVTGDKIEDGAVDTAKVKNGSITGDKLAPDTIPVKSVNTKTGDVVLSAEDVGAIAAKAGSIEQAYYKDASILPSKLSRPDVFYDNAYVVTISKTGGFKFFKTIPGGDIEAGTLNIDKLANAGAENAGKLLKIGADGQPRWLSGESAVTAGVESVNGKDGVVVLTAKDIGAIEATAKAVQGQYLQFYSTPEGIASVRALLNKPTGEINLNWPNSPDITISENDRISLSGAPVSIQSRSVAGMTLYGITQMRIAELTEGKTIVGAKNGFSVVTAITSVNGKQGAVILTADDIDGALKEVAPSNVLVDQTVDGTYLLLAPADGSTDAFQKTDKLPEKMLPTDIDGNLLKDGTVGTGKLVGLSVTTDKIAAGAVTGPKLGVNSVSTSCVQDGAVTLAKLNQPGAAESGKVLGVSGTGQWELQAPSSTGDWEEIPATSLIDGATVHCRIQPGTGWLWFSITSNDGTEINLANAKSGSASAATTNWGTINVNVCNKPVPPNGSSASSDSYPGSKNNVYITGITTATINDTSVSKLNAQSTTSLTPYLTIKRNNTGVTLFGVSSTSSTAIKGAHGDFFITYWFDNRTIDGSETYPSV